jgi:hypothetical protein
MQERLERLEDLLLRLQGDQVDLSGDVRALTESGLFSRGD